MLEICYLWVFLEALIKKADNLDIYFSETEWFKLNQIRDFEWPDRNKLILDAAIQQCSWTNLRLERARALLKVLSEVATKRNIDLSLDAGTLLAYVRHGGIMLWDACRRPRRGTVHWRS